LRVCGSMMRSRISFFKGALNIRVQTSPQSIVAGQLRRLPRATTTERRRSKVIAEQISRCVSASPLAWGPPIFSRSCARWNRVRRRGTGVAGRGWLQKTEGHVVGRSAQARGILTVLETFALGFALGGGVSVGSCLTDCLIFVL
jgi:hypothetical protein